jgi:hypothetical protein
MGRKLLDGWETVLRVGNCLTSGKLFGELGIMVMKLLDKYGTD